MNQSTNPQDAYQRDVARGGLERGARHQRERGLVGAGRGLADGVREHLHLAGGAHRVLVAAGGVERTGTHLAERGGERGEIGRAHV